MNDSIAVIPNYAGWPTTKLSTVCTLIRRGTAPVYVESSGVYAIGQRCVTSTDFNASAARPHSEHALGRVLEPQLEDVLVNSTGTGTIGRSVVFNDMSRRYIVDGHVTVVRAAHESSVGQWINEALRSPWFQQYLESHCYSGSTNQIELSSSALAGAPVAVPPLPVQLQIAEVVKALDARIRAGELLIGKLNVVRTGCLRDIFTHGLDSRGRVDDSGRARLSKIGLVPSGWRIGRLQSFLTVPITYGIVQAGPHIPGGVPYIRTGDMSGDRIFEEKLLRTSSRIASKFERSSVRSGEIVCAIRATVGKVLPVPPELDGANLTQGTARIAPGQSIDAGFLLWELRFDRFQRQVSLAVKGTTFPEITLASLRELLIAVPDDIGEQRRIAEILDQHVEREQAEAAELAKIRVLRQGMLRDLMTGRVKVRAGATS